jgi:hypothetical protein
MYHKRAIEKSPLQAYTSALVFSPARSLIRCLFKEEEPKLIAIKPAMRDEWSTCLRTLEGHSGAVFSVAFLTRLSSAGVGVGRQHGQDLGCTLLASVTE